MLENYFPIIVMLIAGMLFGVVMVRLNEWFGPRNPHAEKMTTYESGMEPVKNARERFSVKFYLLAVFFILFDIEVVFLYSWAVVFQQTRAAGFLSMLAFIAILEVGHYYIWRKGALEWD